MRRVHGHFDTAPELLKLVSQGCPFALLRLFDSPFDWSDFDIGRARFDRLRFDFGSALRIRLRDGTTLETTTPRHPGAAGSPRQATRRMDLGKLDELDEPGVLRAKIEDLERFRCREILSV